MLLLTQILILGFFTLMGCGFRSGNTGNNDDSSLNELVTIGTVPIVLQSNLHFEKTL